MATEVVLPMLGITVERGKIVEWMKQEGDSVEKGEVIFVVETEKVTTEVESPASGVLAKILIPVGEEVPVLTVVAIITEAGEELPDDYAAQVPGIPSVEAQAEARVEPDSVLETARPAPAVPGGPVRAMPTARKLARDKTIDLESIIGTGPEGVILLRDVKEALAAPAVKVSTLARKLSEKEGVALEGITGTGVRGRVMRTDVERAIEEAAAPALGKVIPMNNIRQVISRRMSESAFTAPHIYFFSEVLMDPLLRFRSEILPDFEKTFGVRPSINDFLIKAVAVNILDFPLLNATIKGQEIHIWEEINVGLAVAMPDGLIVPAIPNADRAGMVEIVRQRTDLVDRARKGKLSLPEMERGTFTISSLAQYDITHFTAILNPPQSGILTVGKTREELALFNDEITSRKVATLGLSVDHRIIDGTLAADFLQNLKWKLERPAFTFLRL